MGYFRGQHGINKNIPGLGPQKTYSSRATSAAEKACLSRMTRDWCMRKWNTELAYCADQSPASFNTSTIFVKSRSLLSSLQPTLCCCDSANTLWRFCYVGSDVSWWSYICLTLQVAPLQEDDKIKLVHSSYTLLTPSSAINTDTILTSMSWIWNEMKEEIIAFYNECCDKISHGNEVFFLYKQVSFLLGHPVPVLVVILTFPCLELYTKSMGL